MLKEHKELLGKVRVAREKAVAMYGGGAKVMVIIQKLREVESEVQARVSFLEKAERKAAAVKAAPAGPSAD